MYLPHYTEKNKRHEYHGSMGFVRFPASLVVHALVLSPPFLFAFASCFLFFFPSCPSCSSPSSCCNTVPPFLLPFSVRVRFAVLGFRSAMKENTGAKETAAPSASVNLVSPVFPSFCPFTTSFREPSSLPSCFFSSSSASTHCPTALSGSHPSSSPSHPSSSSFFPSPLRSIPPGSSSSSSSSVFPPLSYAVEACPPALRVDGASKEAEAAPATAAEAEKWEEHPLFMTSMPSGEAFKRNPLLAALAAVIDEEEQLPFRAQRRRGRGGEGGRDKEQEAGGRDKATTQKQSLVFSSEQDVEKVSTLLGAEGRGTTVIERDAATAVAQEKRRAGNRSARPTAACAAYRSHRNSCVPYAARQRATVGKSENEEEGREAAECTLSSEASALETETELHPDAPASMGELQICMKMWQM